MTLKLKKVRLKINSCVERDLGEYIDYDKELTFSKHIETQDKYTNEFNSIVLSLCRLNSAILRLPGWVDAESSIMNMFEDYFRSLLSALTLTLEFKIQG